MTAVLRIVTLAGATLLGATVTGAQARPVAASRSANAVVQPAPRLTTWAIDATHSELEFRIRHLLGRVSGTFTRWSGSVAIDTTDWANSSVAVDITTASIDTREPRRDGHLRSADFFAADSFPTITFRSTRVERSGSDLRVAGDLTIRGRTKPVVLVGRYIGTGKDASGQQRVAFSASTTINRLDYGVSWNRAVETGAMLGDDVTIDVTVQAVQKP
jgi:polyisoprenoid-binding protein YceI